MDYHFVDDAEFDRLIETGGLLEWAEYAGNRYGTPAGRCGAARRRAPALLEIDLQGARQVRAAIPRRSWCSWPRRAGPAGQPAGRPGTDAAVQSAGWPSRRRNWTRCGSSTASSSTTTSTGPRTSW